VLRFARNFASMQFTSPLEGEVDARSAAGCAARVIIIAEASVALASTFASTSFTSPLVGEVDARSAAGEGEAPQAPATQAASLGPNPSPIKGEGLKIDSCACRFTCGTPHLVLPALPSPACGRRIPGQKFFSHFLSRLWVKDSRPEGLSAFLPPLAGKAPTAGAGAPADSLAGPKGERQDCASQADGAVRATDLPASAIARGVAHDARCAARVIIVAGAGVSFPRTFASTSFTSPLVGEVDARSAAGEGEAPQAPATQAAPSPQPLPRQGGGAQD
jgi:hypothetical protein